MPKYVVGASVGSGLGLLLLGYVLYRYYEDKEEAKARDVRKAEYFRQQTLIAEAARAETAKYIEEENKRISAKRAEKLHINKSKNKGKQSRSGGGAFAAGSELENGASLSPVPSSAGSANSSSYNLSSLHSSENNFEQYKIKVRRARKREVVTEKSVNVVDEGIVASVGSFIRSGTVSDSDGSSSTSSAGGGGAYDSSGGSVEDDDARALGSSTSDIIAGSKVSGESVYDEGSSESSADESSVSASSDSSRSSEDYTRLPSLL